MSAKLRSLVESRGISNRELAKRLKARGVRCSHATINRWTEGKSEPRLRDALELAEFFGVPLVYLADDSLDAPPPREATLSPAEAGILFVFRASGLSAEDAARRLMGAASRPALPPATVTHGIPVDPKTGDASNPGRGRRTGS